MNQEANIKHLQKEIELDLLNSGADLFGFADVSDMTFSDSAKLQSAMAIGIAYDPEVVARLDSKIDAFENHLDDTKRRMQDLLEICDRSLKESGFTAWAPPISTNLPGLLSDFPHKTAATKAGLGWIGKNALFVSEEFGCGVRLATALTDARFAPGEPVAEIRCGDCIECVKACPYGAIRATNWHPGIEREKLLDASLCSEEREAFISKLGYKHPCGLCIKSCPVGKGREHYGEVRDIRH